MNRKITIYLLGFVTLMIVGISGIYFTKDDFSEEGGKLKAVVLSRGNDVITVQDQENIIYTFKVDDIGALVGSNVVLQYSGLLDKSTEIQKNDIVSYTFSSDEELEDGIPSSWKDQGIFSQYYLLAYHYLQKMSLDEKIGQLFLVRYPDSNQVEELKKYHFGGYVFFAKDFQNKTESEVQNMMRQLQSASSVPILTAVDEEGGKVVRVSSNFLLIDTPFKSSQELYKLGGFDMIAQDTIAKSEFLKNLGINLNLAPVVDVSTNSSDYIYERSFGQNTALTSTYAKTVIDASLGSGVSYTLKHFPGYRSNSDTHQGSSVDDRSLEEIKRDDLPPFEAGISSGAEAVMVAHNTVTAIDANNPASLSASVHNLLRSDLGFTGIIVSDNLDMGAVSSISDVAVMSILAGNDLIITTDYQGDIAKIKKAVEDGVISEGLIDKLAFRVIAWKYYKGLMFENQK